MVTIEPPALCSVQQLKKKVKLVIRFVLKSNKSFSKASFGHKRSENALVHGLESAIACTKCIRTHIKGKRGIQASKKNTDLGSLWSLIIPYTY